MGLDKGDAYTAKETLGYRERKTYVAAARGCNKKRGKPERDERKNKHTNK